jgi:hypothetical protein
MCSQFTACTAEWHQLTIHNALPVHIYVHTTTVSQAVDEFILSRAAGAGQTVKLQSSFGFMPERAYFTDQFQEVRS